MSDYFGEARDRMDARAATRTDRELELRKEALGTLALGDREATREALLVLADWWDEAGDVRGAATRAVLERDDEWEIDAADIYRVTLSGEWAVPDPVALHVWRSPVVRVWTAIHANPRDGSHDAQVEVLLGGEPFPAPVEAAPSLRPIERPTPAQVAYEARGTPIGTVTFSRRPVAASACATCRGSGAIGYSSDIERPCPDCRGGW